MQPADNAVYEVPEFFPRPAVPGPAVDADHPDIHAGTFLSVLVIEGCCLYVKARSYVQIPCLFLRTVNPFDVLLELVKPRLQPVPIRFKFRAKRNRNPLPLLSCSSFRGSHARFSNPNKNLSRSGCCPSDHPRDFPQVLRVHPHGSQQEACS